jgi:Tfp pilus assembly protein PilX
MMSTFRTLHDRNSARRDDDGVALLMSLFLIVVAAALSLAIGGLVLAAAKPTQFAKKNTRTVNAAQAGFDVALAQIRAARFTTDPNTGDSTKLPCGPLSGSVSVNEGQLNYQVSIQYYLTDPAGKSATWRTANVLGCTSGSGPTKVPSYAVLSSAGTGAGIPNAAVTDGNRTLESIYDFETTNANIPGGPIFLYQKSLCMDAGSATPASGTVLKVQTCVTGLPQQQWAYRSDLTIALTSTLTSGSGMCLDAVSANYTQVQLKSCSTARVQQWSFNDSAAFEGASTTRLGALSGYCFEVMSPYGAGSNVQVYNFCGGYDSKHTWRPDPAVGAGAAGASTNQLVNYQQFGRCLDVTNQTVTYAFLIAFPCKQAPSAQYITWNQKFAYNTARQQYYTTTNGSNYCLQSGTSSNLGASGSYVLTKKCSTSDSEASQRWTFTGETGNYTTSYNVIQAESGLCMSLGPPGATTGALAQWSTIIVETCDGSLEQKWNAPPALANAILRDTHETR